MTVQIVPRSMGLIVLSWLITAMIRLDEITSAGRWIPDLKLRLRHATESPYLFLLLRTVCGAHMGDCTSIVD